MEWIKLVDWVPKALGGIARVVPAVWSSKRWALNRARLGFASDLQRLLDQRSKLAQWPADPTDFMDKIGDVWMTVTNERDVHTTAKFIADSDMVFTVGRSRIGLRSRPIPGANGSATEQVPISGSSAFEKLTNSEPLLCYCAKNLTAESQHDYKNNRPRFWEYLRAAVVFPVYKPGTYQTMGFLTFDVIDKRGFKSLPCYRSAKSLQSYNHALERSAAFHLGRGLSILVGDLWWSTHKMDDK